MWIQIKVIEQLTHFIVRFPSTLYHQIHLLINSQDGNYDLINTSDLS